MGFRIAYRGIDLLALVEHHQLETVAVVDARQQRHVPSSGELDRELLELAGVDPIIV